jgi:UDP-N-acetyl-D-glucosamine/UDP-N-acetyl-D-galactosamine dehydrogenase
VEFPAHKAQAVGYHPEMILAGRRLNDSMGIYVAQRVAQLMIRKRIQVSEARILVMGLAFKENCPDVRNSRVVDVLRELIAYGARVDVYDPWVDADVAEHEYGFRPVSRPRPRTYDAIVLAVAHRQFRELGIDEVRKLARRRNVIFDIKHVFTADQVDGRL